MYHTRVLLLCRVGDTRSAHVVPKRAEQTDKVLLRPLMPRPFRKTAHEKTQSPSQRLRKDGHATGSRYDAHVLSDLDRKAPARPRQHPSCAVAADAAATAAFCLLSANRYMLVFVFVFRHFCLVLAQAGGLLTSCF